MSSSEKTCPAELPIFPLTGSLLLPGSRLPLHIFEPRYRSMVEDALAEEGFFGMIQPLTPRQDNAPAPGEEEASERDPELYEVGCAGLISRWEKLADGRFFVLLEGMSRFRVVRELAGRSGYRRVEADYREFAADSEEPEASFDARRLMSALESFSESHRLELDLEKVSALEGIAVLNGLAMGLPFAPAEKQAMLEAVDLEARHEILLSLLRMGIELRGTYGTPVPAN